MNMHGQVLSSTTARTRGVGDYWNQINHWLCQHQPTIHSPYSDFLPGAGLESTWCTGGERARENITCWRITNPCVQADDTGSHIVAATVTVFQLDDTVCWLGSVYRAWGWRMDNCLLWEVKIYREETVHSGEGPAIVALIRLQKMAQKNVQPNTLHGKIGKVLDLRNSFISVYLSGGIRLKWPKHLVPLQTYITG